ncbi:hypothetical protein, partial [Candidatus Erwinia dacicola]
PKINCPFCNTGGILRHPLTLSQRDADFLRQARRGRCNNLFINVKFYNQKLTLAAGLYFYLPIWPSAGA